ncbi:hypothetical protein [Croceibacterium ferulae]|uniref:hypothetical protein n=1 Tax=Croceibacterium ferulae TaxID=1854641 RepID=UPI000F8825E6|nr:hypothetical protein [Croceibacterium ferulae]
MEDVDCDDGSRKLTDTPARGLASIEERDRIRYDISRYGNEADEIGNERRRVSEATEPSGAKPADGTVDPIRVVARGDKFQEVVRDWLTSDRNALVVGPDQEPQNEVSKGTAAPTQDITLAEVAAQLYEERRLRDVCFREVDIFGEPAWDILLDVAFAEARGEKLSVSKVCIGSCVPVSTANRWINILQSRNLVYKVGDTGDPLETFVRLTEQGHENTKRYLASVRTLRHGRPAT